ncbi:MAG: hypothetical protein K2Y01_06120 [Rhabdochlamydiaceae bacterium]|nr:hypothetical protein [Rhabdochlamydiaceae bacterium]
MSISTVGSSSLALENSCPVNLVSSLLGRRVVEEMRQKPQCVAKEARERELSYLNGRMHSVSLLVANLIIKTIAALKANNFEALDANPGDMGCQNRALALRNLYKIGLPTDEELTELEQAAFRIKKSVQDRKGGAKHADKSSPDEFFQNEIHSLRVSKEMEYALHCFLSKMLVQKYEVLEDGRTREKSNVNQLSNLSPRIENILESGLRTSILENNQTKLSLLSLEAVRREAAEISTLPSAEKELMEMMLSPERTHLYTQNAAYDPKTFGCHFYEVKTLLHQLRESEGVICFKSIVPKGQESFSLFFKSPLPGADFVPVPEELISPLDPVVVFEAVSHVDSNTCRDLLMERGFTDVILSQIAKEDPYEHGSRIEHIEIPSALDEVVFYKGLGEGITFLTVDHVYFTVKK